VKPETIVSFCSIDSPIGRLTLTSDGTSLTGLYMANPAKPPPRTADWVMDPTVAPLPEAVRQLREYFAGERQKFDLPLHMHGTDFQRRVWQQLTSIPFGETWSYAQLARQLDNPSACRAVGLANGKNPIAIIVPCHRVIGADGSLTGFGGGLPRKEWLLSHEGRPGTASLRFG
jgi:methylated-DNA-[protein]-cysteine S-methyltransferase